MTEKICISLIMVINPKDWALYMDQIVEEAGKNSIALAEKGISFDYFFYCEDGDLEEMDQEINNYPADLAKFEF